MHSSNFSWLRKPSRLAATVCVFAATVVILAMAMPAIERQLDAWGMLPRHEQLTELYFTDPSALPKTFAAGELLKLSFSAHNSQSRTARYTYTITESTQEPVQSRTLATGTFTLKANENRTLTVQLTPADLGKHVYLSIALSGNEHIGYWLEQK